MNPRALFVIGIALFLLSIVALDTPSTPTVDQVVAFRSFQHSTLVGEAPPILKANVGVIDDMSLEHPPSVTAGFINSVLCNQYHSPACGTGEVWMAMGRKYTIDPAYGVAFFIHESTAGTAVGWAGLKPDGSSTHNVGNIVCAGWPTCYRRFRDYTNWETGIEDWFRLIRVEYIQGRGHKTVSDVIPVYAPSFENDVGNYDNVVSALVAEWRKAQQSPKSGADTPETA